MSNHTAPAWVLSTLEEHLPRQTRIINLRSTHHGGFLVNTTSGAAFLSKTRLGEPNVHLLELPGRHNVLQCEVCANRMGFADTTYPDEVFCSHCGTPYVVHEGGHFVRAGDPQAVMPWADRKGALRAPTPRGPTVVYVDPEEPPEPDTETPLPVYHQGDYTLYERETDLKGGGTATIYFFAKNTPKSGTPTAMPNGYEVGVNDRTGLPFLRRTGKKPQAYRPQCLAITPAGAQCRNSARDGSKYCGSHKGYHPPTKAEAAKAKDTLPRVRKAKDTAPVGRKTTQRDKQFRPQCQALTAHGDQCRNSARGGSKYCGSHKGYRPPAESVVSPAKDTLPRVRKAKDTAPSSRKEREPAEDPILSFSSDRTSAKKVRR